LQIYSEHYTANYVRISQDMTKTCWLTFHWNLGDGIRILKVHDIQVLQSSVETEFRWGGKHYNQSVWLQISLGIRVPIIMKIWRRFLTGVIGTIKGWRFLLSTV